MNGQQDQAQNEGAIGSSGRVLFEADSQKTDIAAEKEEHRQLQNTSVETPLHLAEDAQSRNEHHGHAVTSGTAMAMHQPNSDQAPVPAPAVVNHSGNNAEAPNLPHLRTLPHIYQWMRFALTKEKFCPMHGTLPASAFIRMTIDCPRWSHRPTAEQWPYCNRCGWSEYVQERGMLSFRIWLDRHIPWSLRGPGHIRLNPEIYGFTRKDIRVYGVAFEKIDGIEDTNAFDEELGSFLHGGGGAV